MPSRDDLADWIVGIATAIVLLLVLALVWQFVIPDPRDPVHWYYDAPLTPVPVVDP